MRTNFRGAFAGLVRGIPATVALILANVAVYAAMSTVDSAAAAALDPAAWLTRWGGNIGGLTFTGEPWRLFSSLFVHAGGLHLAFNALALLEIGGVVERRLGAWRTLAIYLLAGLGGAFCSARWHSDTLSVGASGAVFGLLAALIVFGFFARDPLRGPYGDPVSPGRALVFGALTLALGLFFNFDNAAHLGGFAFGAALALAALLAERLRPAALGAFVFALALLAVGLVLADRTAQAFDAERAVRRHFAQLLAVLRAADADTQTPLRRCALVSASERRTAPAEAFIGCLGETMPDNDAAPSRAAVVNRYGPLLASGARELWPACGRLSDQLLQLNLRADRRAVVHAAARHCEARARLEAGVLAGSAGNPLDPATLREDLLGLQRQTARLAQWHAELTPDDQELARLVQCPLTTCRRLWAR